MVGVLIFAIVSENTIYNVLYIVSVAGVYPNKERRGGCVYIERVLSAVYCGRNSVGIFPANGIVL